MSDTAIEIVNHFSKYQRMGEFGTDEHVQFVQRALDATRREASVILINRSLPFNCEGKVTGWSGVEYGTSTFDEAIGAHVCRMTLEQWRACRTDVSLGATRRWSQWEVDIELVPDTRREADAEIAKLTSERNEWRCSALLYHSELRDLAADKKVETQLGFPVEQKIAILRTEIARWNKLADQWQAAESLASKDADALRAEIAALKEERDRVDASRCEFIERAERAEKERDEAQGEWTQWKQQCDHLENARDALRARLEATRGALEQVKRSNDDMVGDDDESGFDPNGPTMKRVEAALASEAPAPSDPTDAPGRNAILEAMNDLCRFDESVFRWQDKPLDRLLTPSPNFIHTYHKLKRALRPQPADGARDAAAGRETL